MSARQAIDAAFLRGLPLPDHDGGDKESRGRIMVIGGGRQVPGAALLAAVAALRAGAGKLQIATARSVAVQLGVAVPEALVSALDETPEGEIDPSAGGELVEQACRCKAVLIGPGMLGASTAAELAALLLRDVDGPAFVLDAAALTGFCDRPGLMRHQAGRVVITPHAGEMATLLRIDRDSVLADPIAAARRVAEAAQCVVTMKGACTYVVSPQGEAWSCGHGSVGLGTSGSGDVLAGIIAGLLARGVAPVVATQWGVFLHAEAGQRLSRSAGPIGYLARELSAEIPGIMAELSA